MGVVEAGTVTKAHCHVNGVLHMAGRGGCKLWVVRYVADGDEQRASYTVVQEDGDLLYLPPGWSHKVHTMQGNHCNGRELCMHWVTWCMPYARLERSILAFACGMIQEGQNPNARTLQRLRRMHALVLQSKATRRDKKRPSEGRIQVGEQFQAHLPEYKGEIPDTPRPITPTTKLQRA